MGLKGIQLPGVLMAVLAIQLLESGSAWTSNLQPSHPKAIAVSVYCFIDRAIAIFELFVCFVLFLI